MHVFALLKIIADNQPCFFVTFEETPLVQPESTEVSITVGTLQVN